MSDEFEVIDHVFQMVGLTKEKLQAVCRRSCRAGFRVFLDAADPTTIPAVRIYRVEFEQVEDRDRTRIAMRFVEKEMAELNKEAAARAVAPKQAAKPAPAAAKTPAATRLAPA